MIKQIENVHLLKNYIFEGPLISTNANLIEIELLEVVQICMNKLIEQNNTAVNSLLLEDLQILCSALSLKIVLYPNNVSSIIKLGTDKFDLKNCYLVRNNGVVNSYLICIAMDEIQPNLYRAKVVGAFIIE